MYRKHKKHKEVDRESMAGYSVSRTLDMSMWVHWGWRLVHWGGRPYRYYIYLSIYLAFPSEHVSRSILSGQVRPTLLWRFGVVFAPRWHHEWHCFISMLAGHPAGLAFASKKGSASADIARPMQAPTNHGTLRQLLFLMQSHSHWPRPHGPTRASISVASSTLQRDLGSQDTLRRGRQECTNYVMNAITLHAWRTWVMAF